MVICAHCQTDETDLYASGIPICLNCSEVRDREIRERVLNPKTPQVSDIRSESASMPTTSRKPSGKSQKRQPRTDRCFSLHDWIGDICSRCGAKKTSVSMVARAG